MTSRHRIAPSLVLAGIASLCAAQASATAYTGGVVSMIVGAHPDTGETSCQFSQVVSLGTQQDSVAISGGTACNGESGYGALYSSAATAKVGISGTALGNALGSTQVSAEVSLIDFWTINAPAGTAPNTVVSIPVSFTLDGSISPGATFYSPSTTFLTTAFVFGPAFGGPYFTHYDSISGTGVFAQTFSGLVNFLYTGQPIAAEINLMLSLNKLSNGAVDFYNTAAISLDLPPGYTAFTSSGVQLFATVAAPVPEPATGAMLALGLGLLVCLGRTRRRSADAA